MSKIIIKFPTRDRVDKFFNVLNLYYYNLSGKHDVSFMINCDVDDRTMNNNRVISRLDTYNNLKYYFGENDNKIEAINANFNDLGDYDVLLLASDDMIPQVKNYDDIIAEEMNKNFPDGDGVLWFNDGVVGDTMNTLSIVGKKYLDRFGYIYNPLYKSFFCDGEFFIIAAALKKQVYIDQVIIKHDHYTTGKTPMDKSYQENHMFWDEDLALFYKRRPEILKINSLDNLNIVNNIP